MNLKRRKEKKIKLNNIRHRYKLRRYVYRGLLLSSESKNIIPTEDILSSEVEVLSKEKELFKEHLIRLKAEFENYRKRAEKEKKEIIDKANESLLKDLLSSLDQFEIALKNPGNIQETDPFYQGMKMVNDSMINILSYFGLKKINAIGEIFDPYYHEAIAVEKSVNAKDNEIIQVLREGYIYKDKVIRPTLVKVAKNN